MKRRAHDIAGINRSRTLESVLRLKPSRSTDMLQHIDDLRIITSFSSESSILDINHVDNALTEFSPELSQLAIAECNNPPVLPKGPAAPPLLGFVSNNGCAQGF
jgi:hypothetical protein